MIAGKLGDLVGNPDDLVADVWHAGVLIERLPSLLDEVLFCQLRDLLLDLRRRGLADAAASRTSPRR